MDMDNVINAIKRIVYEIKQECIINNTAIKDSIFSILENNCTVLYYPFDNENNRGFHTKKIVGNELKDFVYINTAKPIAEQIFTAAHEFGHIWSVGEKVWGFLKYETKPTEDEIEDITNLFAAELLMPTSEFKKAFVAHIKDLGIEDDIIKFEELIQVIALLMEDFMVPCRAVIKRFKETSIISEETEEQLLSIEGEVSKIVDILMKDRNTYLGSRTKVKTISGIRGLIEEAEKEDNVDTYLLMKMKKEFQFRDVPNAKKNVEFQIGDSDE